MNNYYVGYYNAYNSIIYLDINEFRHVGCNDDGGGGDNHDCNLHSHPTTTIIFIIKAFLIQFEPIIG